jgi:integrase
LSRSTINRHLEVLSVVLHLARDKWQVLHRIPKITLLPVVEGRRRVLTPEEEADVIERFDELKHPELGQLTAFLADTGMREGNALKLEWRDINMRTGMITLWQNKVDEPYSIPMTERVRGILEVRKENPLGPFIGISPTTYQHNWSRAKKLMKLDDDPQFVPYALRHTACTRLIEAGMPLEKVRQFMGHLELKTTLKYTHLNPESLRELAEVLDKNCGEFCGDFGHKNEKPDP